MTLSSTGQGKRAREPEGDNDDSITQGLDLLYDYRERQEQRTALPESDPYSPHSIPACPGEEEEEEEEEEENMEELGFFRSRIVGLRYYNGIVGRREKVLLVRDPRNPYDKNAIKCLSVTGGQVGHIPRAHAVAFSTFMDKGWISLEGVCPNGSAKSTFQTIVELDIFVDPPNKEEVLTGLASHGVHLADPRERQPSKPELLNLLPQDLQQVETIRDAKTAQQALDLFCPSALDLAHLPHYPYTPTVLTTQLLPHQLQGLAWMIRSEHPRFPSRDSPLYIQFWLQQQGKEVSAQYVHAATHSVVKDPPTLMRGGILADDMGLGKTLQTIALLITPDDGTPIIQSPTSGPSTYSKSSLIICPLSVMGNWVRQLEEHVKEGSISWVIHHGPQRTKSPKDLAKVDVIITTYQTMASEYSTGTWDRGPLFHIMWKRVILDEAHLIRNPKSRQSQAAASLRAERRWALSGTPIVNHPTDLYGLLRFLHYAPFDQPEWFSRCFQRPLAKGNPMGYDNLKLLMRTLCIRRTKSMRLEGKPLVNLPPCTVYLHRIPFATEEEKRVYHLMEDQARKVAQRAMMSASFARALVLLGRMRQLCNHPSLCPQSTIREAEQAALGHSPVAQVGEMENHDLLLQSLREAINHEEECCVCMEGLTRSGRITRCSHIYCQGCINRVLTSTHEPICPMCRGTLSPSQVYSLPASESIGLDKRDPDSHPDGLSKAIPSSKISALLILLDRTAKPVKSIIFSQWTGMLDLLEPHLHAAGIPFDRIDGKVPRHRRDQAIQAFSLPSPRLLEGESTRPGSQAPLDHNSSSSSSSPPRVLLISLSCGSLGLNLTAASQVFLMDPWWNSSIQEQAIDRVYRLGQTRPVRVFQLIIADSVEERVMQIQRRKRDMIQKAFSGLQYEGTSLTDIPSVRSARPNDLEAALGLVPIEDI
ncbi:MAG: SNF2 family N-terminal domain-containing protein [Piptocephalis tieghemiana]|nr:MAG: SNF2 family N-terminal domain-containing protein [Piptocephalis tieghemiana]